MEGTQNFRASELNYMEDHPNARAIGIGKNVPYHLQYIRDGKPNIKPEKENKVNLDHD